MSRKFLFLLWIAMLLLAACTGPAQPQPPTPEDTPAGPPPQSPTPEATPTGPVETAVPTMPVETVVPTEPVETTTPTVPVETAAPTDPVSTPGPEDPLEQPEPIMILQPAPGSRVLSPVTIRGEADPTFEQNLGIRIYTADGALLAESSATIAAELGQRGPFEADVEFDVVGEENIFIQVFSTSARDGGITHLSSVGVIAASEGEEQIRVQEPYNQRVVITSPAAQPQQTISGGTARVEGFGLASFEQTLVLQVQDEMGNVVGQTPVIVNAPDLGIPGPFAGEVAYEIDAPQPGRIVVRDPSPAFGGDVYLTSVEVQLQP